MNIRDRELLENLIFMGEGNSMLVKKIIKKASGSPPAISEKCRIAVECDCGESSFDMPFTEKDIEIVYDRFVKRCPVCHRAIRVTFDFRERI